MLAIGFDPSFLDIIIRLEDKNGNLIDKLPKVGHHHRNSKFTRIAGGNGVNIGTTLHKLGFDPKLVIPLNEEFIQLLNNNGLSNLEGIDSEISQTVAITWKEGEIQLNEIRGDLNRNNWTERVHDLWQDSPIHVMTNWGLNPSSLEWVYLQWISASGISYSEIQFDDLKKQAFGCRACKKYFVIEPGSIQEHRDREKLLEFLQYMSNCAVNTILCMNEEEAIEYKEIKNFTKITHTATNVTIQNSNGKIIITVPPLQKEPVNFVGAGDAFTAGIVESILKNDMDIKNMVKNGIRVSQMKIIGIL